MNLTIEVELTEWRESNPPGLTMRDWRPVSQMLPVNASSGEPGVHGGAAAVRDEHPVPGWVGEHRWSWRIWTPIGTTWPYRGGAAGSKQAAMDAADAALSALAALLTGQPTPPEHGAGE